MGNNVKNSNAWIFFADKDIQIAELAVDNAELSGEVTFQSRYPSNIGLFQDGSLPTIEDAKSYLDFAKSISSIVKSEIL